MLGYYSTTGVKLPKTGGNSKEQPLWKQLGYSSEKAYLNSIGGGNAPVGASTEPIDDRVSFLEQTPKLESYSATFTGEPKLEDYSPTSTDDGGGNSSGGSSNSKDWWNNFYNDQKNTLLSLYGGTQKKLDDEKKSSQQAASIAYDKLKKYLPTQIKAQGLGGLGVSESTMLQAQNNYASQMADISSVYSANTADLEAQKASALGELENYRAAKLDGIQTDEWNTAYDNATVSIDNSGIYDQEQMTKFVEQFRGQVSDSQFNALLARGQSVVAANKEQHFDIDTEVKKIRNGEYVNKENGTPYSWEQIYAALLHKRSEGENITDADISTLKKEYEAWRVYNDGKVSPETYYDSLNGDEQAGNKVDKALNWDDYVKQIQEKAKSEYKLGKAGKVVDVTLDTFDILEFGKYLGSGEANSDQNVYLNKIVDDAKAGKIKEGQIIMANCGDTGWFSGYSGYGYYMYLGDGAFMAVSESNYSPLMSLYLPDGYHKDWRGLVYPD